MAKLYYYNILDRDGRRVYRSAGITAADALRKAKRYWQSKGVNTKGWKARKTSAFITTEQQTAHKRVVKKRLAEYQRKHRKRSLLSRIFG